MALQQREIPDGWKRKLAALGAPASRRLFFRRRTNLPARRQRSQDGFASKPPPEPLDIR